MDESMVDLVEYGPSIATHVIAWCLCHPCQYVHKSNNVYHLEMENYVSPKLFGIYLKLAHPPSLVAAFLIGVEPCVHCRCRKQFRRNEKGQHRTGPYAAGGKTDTIYEIDTYNGRQLTRKQGNQVQKLSM